MNYIIKEGNIEFSCEQYSGTLPFSISPVAIGRSGLTDENAGVIFLRSPYFKAAIDRFGVYLDQEGRKSHFGYLFPVSLLDNANEQEYERMKEWQQDMMYIGFKRFLDSCHDGKKLYDINVVETLEEIGVGEDVFIFIYDRDVEKEQTKFVPALYDKGFYVVKDPFGKEELYSSSFMKRMISADVHHKDLILKEATDSFVKFGFVKDLYVNLLPYIKNSAFRFFLLYQVIEFLIDLKKNETWFNTMATFPAKHNNELVHKLMEAGKEESLINKIFVGVRMGDDIYQDFMQYARLLYDGVDKKWNQDTDFPAFMYGVRNIIVHNLKEAIGFEELLVELSERYEKIIGSLIMSTKIDDCSTRGVYVYDLSRKYIENKREFSKLFHSRI